MKYMYWITVSFVASFVVAMFFSGLFSASDCAYLSCILLVGLIISVFVFMGVVIKKLEDIEAILKKDDKDEKEDK